MHFLKITAPAGTITFVPGDYVVQVTTAADATGAVSDYGSGRITRGKITGVKYLDGAAAASPTLTVVTSIPTFASGGTRYEFGCLTDDGAFVAALSNGILSN